MNPILQTQKWLREIVIGLNFCPFAKMPFLDNAIRYVSIKNEDDLVFETILTELDFLNKFSNTETTLIIIDDLELSFSDYLEIIEEAQALLEDTGFEGEYQLASFHPEYQFEETNTEDAENFTNRSPYPMIHILREASIEKALEKVSSPEEIPERNIRIAKEKGNIFFEAVLKSILEEN